MTEKHRQVASLLLSKLRSLLEESCVLLAQQCSKDGSLKSDLLDGLQVPSYELAWANAELLAAETALASTDLNADAANANNALIFALEAIELIRGRLETIFAELDMPAAPLAALFADSSWQRLRRSVLSGQALQASAEVLAKNPEAIGYVPLGQELALVQAQFKRFAVEVVAPFAEQIHKHDLTVPEALLQPLRELGVFGLSIPECYGGNAGSEGEENLSMIVVTEALSEASLGAAGSLITRPEILSRALIVGGTEAQKQKWLPRIAVGDPLCAIAITEPDYGSDVASLALRATKVESGWLLDGAKTWCTFAGKAGLLMVVARTNPDRSVGHRGLSVLLVEKPSYEGREFDYRQEHGGRLVGHAIPTIGYRGMHSFDLSFEGVFVPDANVIGELSGVGRGFYLTMAGMMAGRIQTAARASGVMRAALLAALRYSDERRVFGRSLLGYPLTSAKLSKMAARYVASRHLTYAVGRMVAAGGGRMEASLVKLFACRSAELITREALQIHGGMGYAEEVAVSRYFLDARVLSIFEGAEETLALKVVARGLLEGALTAKAA